MDLANSNDRRPHAFINLLPVEPLQYIFFLTASTCLKHAAAWKYLKEIQSKKACQKHGGVCTINPVTYEHVVCNIQMQREWAKKCAVGDCNFNTPPNMKQHDHGYQAAADKKTGIAGPKRRASTEASINLGVKDEPIDLMASHLWSPSPSEGQTPGQKSVSDLIAHFIVSPILLWLLFFQFGTKPNPSITSLIC